MWYVSEKNIHASLTSKDIACYLLGVVCNISYLASLYMFIVHLDLCFCIV